MSPFALWFAVGAIVALYSLFIDFQCSKRNKILLYTRCAKRGDVPVTAQEFYNVYYPIEATVFTLLGPTAVFAFYGKCSKLTKESRNKSTHI